MRIFRVENESGHGPYAYGRMASAGFSDGGPSHPSPYDDGMDEGQIKPDHHFGFKDMAQLQAWFDDPRRAALARAGFRVSLYEVPSEHVIGGSRQIAYHKAHATKVKSIPLQSRKALP